MALNLQFDSQKYISNHETVKVFQPDNITHIEVIDAVRHPITTGEISQSNGVYLASDVVWCLDNASTPVIQPKWSILDSKNRRYKVLDVAESDIGNFHRCTTRNLAITYNLRDVVSIYRMQRVNDISGRKVSTPVAYQIELTARVQPIDRLEVLTHGISKLEVPFDVFLEYDPGIKVKDQIRIIDHTEYPELEGVILEVVSITNPMTMTDLPVIRCVDNGARF